MREDRDAADAQRALSEIFDEYVDAGRPLWAHLVRQPRTAVRALRHLRRLPLLDVVLPEGPAASVVAALLLAHPTSRRLTLGVASVLPVPDDPRAVLDGHVNATLRRRCRAALRRGVAVRAVEPDERTELLHLADTRDREHPDERYRVDAPSNADLLESDLWLVAQDETGRAILLAVIPHAGDWAVLRYFRRLDGGAASSDARYLATARVAEELSRRGVRHLVDTARPHWLPNGLRHFQRMTGFRLVRLTRPRFEAKRPPG